MSKIAMTIAAGLVVATGLWGMTQLAAFQDAIGEGNSVTIDSVDGDVKKIDVTAVELTGRTEVSLPAEPPGSVEVSATVVSAVATTPTVEAAPSALSRKQRRPLTGAAAEFSRRSERDAERRLNELMQTERVADLEFPGENPLTDILEKLSVTLSESQGSPIVIRPDVVELTSDSIVLSDVIIRDLMIPEGLMTVGSALDHILSQTDPPLTWIAKDELLLITTVSAAEADENMFLRSYDISRLRAISQLTVSTWETSDGQQGGGGGFFSVVFEPSQVGGAMGGLGGGGMGGGYPARLQVTTTQPSNPEPRKPNDDGSKREGIITWEAGLIQTIQDLTGPPCHWFDIDGDGGKLSIAGNRLIVRQSRKGHQQVMAVLEQLEMAADDAAEEQ